MTGLKPMLAGTAALLIAAAGAHAQTQTQQSSKDQQLSRQEVQQFLQDAQQSMTDAVNGGNFAKILEWTQNRIAEGATFSAEMEFFAGDERKGFTTLTLTKDDMVKLGGISAGILSGMQKGAIEDYSLEIGMTDFTPIGPNAAMVRTAIVERGRIAFPGSSPEMAGRQSGMSGQGQSTQQGSALTPPAGSQQGATLTPPESSLSRQSPGLTAQQGLLSQRGGTQEQSESATQPPMPRERDFSAQQQAPSQQDLSSQQQMQQGGLAAQQQLGQQFGGAIDPRARAQATGRAAEMEGIAVCNHIIQRGEGSQELQMGLTNCQAQARIEMN